MDVTLNQDTVSVERLGDVLVGLGKLTPQQLDKALDVQEKTGDYLGEVLIHLGFVSAADVYGVLSRRRGIPYVDVSDLDIEPEVLDLIPREFADRHTVIPLSVEGPFVKVAVSDHLDVDAFDGISTMTGLQPDLLLSSRRQIRKAILENYSRPEEVEKDMQRLLDSEAKKEAELRRLMQESKSVDPDSPAVRFVNLLLQQAVDRKASDLHLEPHKDSVAMRYRIDGILHDATPPTPAMYPAIVSRIKIMSRLNIAERRLPQDGRFRIEDSDIDVRVSIIPTIHGEKVLMRFLDKTSLVMDLGAIGLGDELVAAYKEALTRTQGIILVTGPTGSGKTTTLYAGISHINTSTRNIMTVEDPVEYVLPTINQIQIHPEINLTFASALRSILRQDPDVIMVGEIRDRETGDIAVRASLTGHLVLSTLHTNSAIAAVARLQSMGVKPYLLGSSLSLVIAQRLIRTICLRCKQPYSPSPAALARLGLEADGQYFTGAGCRYCNNTGYRGRTAIFEFVPVRQEFAHLIAKGVSMERLAKAADNERLCSMSQHGAQKVRDGETTVDEVLVHAVHT
jgi:type IV pilus assembly protein PilB